MKVGEKIGKNNVEKLMKSMEKYVKINIEHEKINKSNQKLIKSHKKCRKLSQWRTLGGGGQEC